MKSCLTAALMLAMPVAAMAAPVKELPPKPTVGDIVKASKPAEWRQLDPANTLYMDLPAGRVVIELAPAFAPNHAANIRTMAREGYWNGLWVYRVQDNFVAQWGDPRDDKPKSLGTAKAKLEQEFTVPMKNDTQFTRLMDKDGYAAEVGHSNGFPAARDPKTGQTWLAHCYGMVGVARGNESDSGNGGTLYAVIGNSPRQLDRNISVVGRIVSGMPLLSVLPRGPAPMGMYDKDEQNVQIKSVKLMADVPEAERTKYEILRTDSASFKAVAEAQRNRGGPWTKHAFGHVDLCNVPIPTREVK
ncbi:peptidylprolyl isomerase [Massilia sp. SR12]